MARILYPNGTEVAFKSADTPRRFKVESYERGSDQPYHLVGVKDSSIRNRASVDEICRFENHRYSKRNKSSGASTPSVASPAYITREQAAKIVVETVEAVRSSLQSQFDRDLNNMHDHLLQDVRNMIESNQPDQLSEDQ